MGGRVRVVLDAMGGDQAPQEAVAGAILAAKTLTGIEVVLVGAPAAIQAELAHHPEASSLNLEIAEATETIAMEESPVQAVRSKRNNSMSVGLRMLKEKRADAFVTAGNTGAALAASMLELGRISGIRRPALATILPGLDRRCLLLDIGANVDIHPQDLVQFALMGKVYSERVMGIPQPRIGLVSNGEEDSKGTQFTKDAHALLRQSGLPFLRNVEGRELFSDTVDVAVTDGFTGNVLVKTAEGLATLIGESLRREALRTARGKLGGLLLKPAMKNVLAHLDYSEVGGAPLLGIAGVVLVGHGRSNAKAIASLIGAGGKVAKENVVEAISEGIKEYHLQKDNVQ